MKSNALRILVLDGHLVDSDAIMNQLNHMDEPVTTWLVHDRSELESALMAFSPDVILADHPLIRHDAEIVVDLSRSLRPSAPLIVLADPNDAPTAVQSMQAGAKDVVFTNSLDRLPAAITAVVSSRSRLKSLTRRQLEVLQWIARGLTTRAIAARLSLSEKTVETHRTELMRRLDIHDLAHLVRYAMRMDLVDGKS